MTGLQIAMAREIGGWPLYTIVIGLGQMLSATSFQITLLTGRNWQDNIQLYVLGGVFLAASAVWYPLFRMKPSVYVLSAPWVFFGLAFFMIGLPSVAQVLHPAHRALSSAATWSYAIASAAAFLFFGLNFGEEAVCCHSLVLIATSSSTMFLRAQQPKYGLSEHVLYRVHSKSGSPHFGIGVTRSMDEKMATFLLGGSVLSFGR